jgi:hypothetical protein
LEEFLPAPIHSPLSSRHLILHILACELCTIGLEKGLTPFVKVGEDQEIYNFGIGHFGYFSLNFWRNCWSKWVSPKCFGTSALELAPSDVGAPYRALPQWDPWARTPRRATTRWSVRRGAALVDPPPRPYPPAQRVARPAATLRRPCRRPPNRDAAVPGRACRRTPRPCHGRVSRTALQATAAYKR